jgi:hypothetical protein
MPDSRPWPRISIVTPSFNQGRFIEETIRSILLQGYPDLEYFVMDGGSSDETLSVIKKYERWIARWVSERDGGQSAAINKGMSFATGEWANWINSDDFLALSALRDVATVGSEFQQTDVISLATQVIAEDGASLFVFEASPVDGPRSFLGKWQMPVPQPSTFVRRPYLIVEETLHYCMDWALYFELAASHRTFRNSSSVAAFFRQHAASKTGEASDCFEAEKLLFVGSRKQTFPALSRTINYWARTREGRMKLSKSPVSFGSLFALLKSEPVLLFDRMYWGAVRRLLIGSKIGQS